MHGFRAHDTGKVAVLGIVLETSASERCSVKVHAGSVPAVAVVIQCGLAHYIAVSLRNVDVERACHDYFAGIDRI